MKILVLGGGAQGRVIAADLASSLPQALITVADLRRPALAARPNLACVEADCSDPETIARLLRDHDLGVGALPSHLGFGAMQAAIAARRNLVDVSFSAEDPLTLDAEARAAGVTIAPDCGLAPGLSNLLLGQAVQAHGIPRAATVMVGGVAEDPGRPYGYVVTWSLDDLMEEYTRPARIVRDGREAIVPVFSGLERVRVDGVGEMEAFYSDGLRTLIHTLPGVREMGEMTLRWPGHVEAIQPLLQAGTLREELRARCTLDPPRDLVAMVVRAWWGDRGEEITLVDRYDSATGLTAMSRTTALTTAAVARLAATGGLGEPGVRPLELIARDERACRFVLDAVAERGVRVARRRADDAHPVFRLTATPRPS
jgi:saccharopine dehydrogenase-like NADP-dependent oxidoreductase